MLNLSLYLWPIRNYAVGHEGQRRAKIAEGGWLVATRGSHRQFKHPTKPGRVTVAGKLSYELPPGTLNSILKQAGLK